MHYYKGAVILPDRTLENGLVQVDGPAIRAVTDLESTQGPALNPQDVTEVPGYIAPGFIDLHCHGGGGSDWMDGDPEGSALIAETHARYGTTGLFATTLTAPEEAIIQAIRAARTAPKRGARILGFHIEGPYINIKLKGAQNGRYVRPADTGEIDRWLAEGGPGYHWHITIAPELEGHHEAIRYLASRGFVVSAGHTESTYAQLAAGVEAGVSHVTHLYNAMRGLHHREPGTVGGALTLPGLTVELITDGVHIHPAAVAAAVRARGPENCILITDAMMATGMPEGEYTLFELPTTVKNGEARLADGTLAGSVHTMSAAVRNTARFTGLPLHTVMAMASLNPARCHRLDGRKGSLAPGKDADIVLLDRDLQVLTTIVEGQVVFDRR